MPTDDRGLESLHSYDVEIIPPESVGPSNAVGPAPRGNKARNGASTMDPPAAAEALLEGTVQVLILPTVPLARIAEFEHALKERPGIRWLGTWGKAKEGTTVVIQLEEATTAASLFRGRTSVETAELSKTGKDWLVRVSITAL